MTSTTLKTSWKMTLILKKRYLKHWSMRTISKENKSAYVDTNYKDVPTLDAETEKKPNDNLNIFRKKLKAI